MAKRGPDRNLLGYYQENQTGQNNVCNCHPEAKENVSHSTKFSPVKMDTVQT